jgi:hypothetical protein
MSCYEIYYVLCNVILTAIISYHPYKQCHQETFDVGNVESRNTFEIWKREERSQSSIMLNYWAHLTKQ